MFARSLRAGACPRAVTNMIVVKKELYFDISSEKKGGSLYRHVDEDGRTSFYYHHSTYDDLKDQIQVFESVYPDFMQFWEELTRDPAWFYLHPLFVHPEQRAFVQSQLRGVNWSLHADPKWQHSHQRQWKKVLEGPESYYRQQ
jgi:hypothetical protein